MFLYPVLNESSVALLEVVKTMDVLTIIGMIVLGCFLILEWINIFERRADLFNNKHVRAPILLLHGVTVFGFLISIGCFLMFQFSWLGMDAQCTVYVRVVTISLWCIMKMFIYGLLYERMLVVHEALHLNHIFLWSLRWIMFLVIVVGIPSLFLPITTYFFQGYVTPEGVCIQYSTSSAVLYFVVSVDFIVNVSLLILFIVPLCQHGKQFNESNIIFSKKIRKMATKNLIISSLLVTILIACLIYMALDSVAGSTGEIGAQQLSGLVAGYIDPTCEVILCHLITSAWIPNFLRKTNSNNSAGKVAGVENPTTMSSNNDKSNGNKVAVRIDWYLSVL